MSASTNSVKDTAKLKTQFVATFDLETYGLEPVFGRLLCGVIKPWGEEPKVFRVRKASADDSKLVTELVTELNRYNILIAHNGLYFDKQFLNGRALEFNQDIIDVNIKMIDPCIIARKNLNLKRNSLDAISEFLNLEERKMHVDSSVWVKAALDHHEESMQTIIERCISDVVVLEMLAQRVMKLTKSINSWGSW